MERTAASAVKSVFHSAREYFNPLLKDSKFRETGVLTPEEFQACGDFLVLKCPSWQWQSGQESRKRDYLDGNKQYLITRNVPCLERALDMTRFEDEGEEDGFITAGDRGERVIKDLDQDVIMEGDQIPDLDEIPDLDDLEMVVNDPSTLPPQENILRTRTYDLSITYDKYYQTPRMWLYGYDEDGKPLNSTQIFEDISEDHAKKTCTIECHPHESITCASIHPCKHGHVVKRLIDRMEQDGKEMRVDQYLMLFLKLMSSILPTMDYDCKSIS